MMKNSMRELSETLQRKKREDQEKRQALLREELERHGNDLRKQLRAVASSTAGDIERELRRLRPFRLHGFLIALAAALMVLLPLVAIEGGIPRWIGQEIRLLLRPEPESPEKRLLIDAGMTLLPDDRGRLVLILPEGREAAPTVWRHDGSGEFHNRWIIRLED